MAKVHVTYNAPEDDSPFVIHGGKRFFDGQPLELDTEVDADMIERLRGNQHFTVEDQAEEPKSAGTW